MLPIPALDQISPETCAKRSSKKAVRGMLVGDVGVDQVPGLVMLEDGGAAQAQPIRQIHLRITSGLWTKKQAIDQYRADRVIGENDVCVIAISGSKCALQAGGLGC